MHTHKGFRRQALNTECEHPQHKLPQSSGLLIQREMRRKCVLVENTSQHSFPHLAHSFARSSFLLHCFQLVNEDFSEHGNEFRVDTLRNTLTYLSTAHQQSPAITQRSFANPMGRWKPPIDVHLIPFRFQCAADCRLFVDKGGNSRGVGGVSLVCHFGAFSVLAAIPRIRPPEHLLYTSQFAS